MSQALQTASTGINAGQQQINVIANNVANINTVAFKSANMTFETLFSNTLSHGSAATKDGGGTNPRQIGLGVKIGGISRNFEIGTFVNTGRDTDVMISGNGYFVVQDSDGKQYYTRDGVFTTDSDGNLVTSSGMKVVGASTPYSGTASNTTVRIPTNLKAEVTDSSAAVVSGKAVKELNTVSISGGTFNVHVTTAAGTEIIKMTVDNDATMGANITNWKAAIAAAGVDEDVFDVNLNAEGKLEFSKGDDVALEFEPIDTNLLAETKISNTSLTSVALNKSAVVQDLLDYNDPAGIAVSSVTIIDENGILSCS